MSKSTKREWTGLAALTLLGACGGGGASGAKAGEVPAFGGVTDFGSLVEIATTNGAAKVRTGPGVVGFPSVRDLAYDAAAGVHYGLAYPWNTVLLRIDVTPGPRGLKNAPQVVADLPTGPGCLAWHPVEKMLYGVRTGAKWSPGQLVRVDPKTGETEDLGECAAVTCLEFDPPSGMLYGVKGAALHRIDPADGSSLELFQEQLWLPKVTGIARDPMTGTFWGAYHDAGTEQQGLVTIDLFGHVDHAADLDQALYDLEVDPKTGALWGLTFGAGLVELVPTTSEVEASALGNVGLEAYSVTRDPANDSYLAVDSHHNLIRFWLSGGSRTMGPIGREVWSLAYDAGREELWGLDSEAGHLLRLDPATGAVLDEVTEVTLSLGSFLAWGGTPGVLWAQDKNVDVTLRIDTVAEEKSIASNGHGLAPLSAMTFDPITQRLVGATMDAMGDWRLHTWNPLTSEPAFTEAVVDAGIGALFHEGGGGRLLATGGSGPGSSDLFEVDFDLSRPLVTVDSVRLRNYRAAVWVPSLGRIVAIDWESAYSIDPATGSTALLGSLPSGSSPSGVTWDPVEGRLGLLDGEEILWTAASTPWHSPTSSSLGAIDVNKIAYAPEPGVFYAVGDDGLFSVAINSTSTAVIELDGTPPPADLSDLTWSQGALWAATLDRRLFRVNVETGVWTELGSQRFRMQGLY